MSTSIGTIKALNLYPVKSMRGVSVAEATLYWYGLNGDRKYAFVQDKPHSSFPWLTAREHLNSCITNLTLLNLISL